MGGAHRGVVARSSLSGAIRAAAAEGTAVMVDIKPVSPRDGDLLGGRSPGRLAAELGGKLPPARCNGSEAEIRPAGWILGDKH